MEAQIHFAASFGNAHILALGGTFVEATPEYTSNMVLEWHTETLAQALAASGVGMAFVSQDQAQKRMRWLYQTASGLAHLHQLSIKCAAAELIHAHGELSPGAPQCT